MDKEIVHPADAAGLALATAKAACILEMHVLIQLTPYDEAGPESLTKIDALVSAAFAAGYEEGADAARRG